DRYRHVDLPIGRRGRHTVALVGRGFLQNDLVHAEPDVALPLVFLAQRVGSAGDPGDLHRRPGGRVADEPGERRAVQVFQVVVSVGVLVAAGDLAANGPRTGQRRGAIH